MPRIIAIMNQKGGVGKTTTTLNLGAALALRGKRVLLIDLDPQANLTLGLGQRAADLSVSVYELLTDPKADAQKLIVHTNWERLDLLPSHIDLSGAEIEMVTMIGRESRLMKSLESARGMYDYILIDCLPSLSLLTVNAMAAAGEVFVPLQAHPFALEGLGKLFEVVGMIREAMNPALKVSGVLVTMFDGRTNVARDTLEALRNDDRLREHIFTTTIKQNIKIAESQKEGMPVITLDPHCHAAKAYMALGEEVLEMETGCVASVCAESITEREVRSGLPQRTFTPDLIAPPSRPESEHAASARKRAEPAAPLPVTPLVHVAPVSALMGSHETAASAPAPAAETAVVVETAVEPPPAELPAEAPVQPPVLKSEPVQDVIQPAAAAAAGAAPLPREVPLNDPATECIHPAAGAYAVSPAAAALGADPVVAAQAAQAGVSLARGLPL